MPKKLNAILLIGVVLLSAFLGYIFHKPPQTKDPFEFLVNKDSRFAACKAIADTSIQDLNLFCRYMNDKMTPQECVKTVFAERLIKRADDSFVIRCSGALNSSSTFMLE